MSKKTMSWVLTFTVMLMLMVVHRTRGDPKVLLLRRGGGGPARVLLSDSPDVDYYYRSGVLGRRVGLQNLVYPPANPATTLIGAPTYLRRGRILSTPFVPDFYN